MAKDNERPKVPPSLEQKVIKLEELAIGEPRILYGIHHFKEPRTWHVIVRRFTRTNDTYLKRESMIRDDEGNWIIVSSTNLTLGSFRDTVFFENEEDCKSLVGFYEIMDALTGDKDGLL